MNFNFSTSDIISFGSLIIALIAFGYTYVTNTKKYELVSQFRTEILKWYSDTIILLIKLRCEAQAEFPDNSLKNDLMSQLSANIEIGRFYFPNVNKGNNYGNKKPLAYRGYRNLVLDFLVYSYQIFNEKEAKKFNRHLESLQKHFTSCLYEILDLKAFLKDTKKHTSKTFSKNLSFEEYISNDPETLDRYI